MFGFRLSLVHFCSSQQNFWPVGELLEIHQNLKRFLLNVMSSTGSNPAPGAVFNMREMRESLALAEQLAKASMSSNKGRSHQLQQLDANNNNEEESPRTYVPPKQLLLYLVRYESSRRFRFLISNWQSKPRKTSKKQNRFRKIVLLLRQGDRCASRLYVPSR